MKISVNPIIEIEHATPADILDGLKTLKGSHGLNVQITPPGDGPDRLLRWALQEVTSAMRPIPDEEREHYCVDAVLPARRALACLVDWYLERDLAIFCKKPPATPIQQVKFLIDRGVIDELTSHVLERVIQKRNDVEHGYRSPSLAEAEDVVELLRRTAAALRTQSPPEYGPWIFGIFLYAVGTRKNKPYAEFHEWSGPLVVFSRFAPQPWVGLVLPKNNTEALIRRALLKEMITEELAQLLLVAEQKFGRPSPYNDAQLCELLASEARLHDV